MGRLLIFLALVYGVLCVALYFMQQSFIYFPQQRHRPDVPLLKLAAGDETILVSTRPRKSADAVIYFGGNAEDVSSSLPSLAEAFPDKALYLMHYRGYGGSSGRPSEMALVADALLLFDRVAQEHSNITVIGRSLGSGVAVQLASERPVARLVLVTPYNSIQELAVARFPYFPVRWILRDKYESWKYAAKVTAPTLIVMAERDGVIPSSSSRALHTHFAKGVAELAVVDGAGHNTIADYPAYVRLLKSQP